MLAVRLPVELENKLADLSAETGKTKAFHIREAVTEYLKNLKNKKRFETWAYDMDNPEFREQLKRECQELDKSQDEKEVMAFCEQAAIDLMNDEEWTW
ncbi:MAG: DUF3018 family protein [Neisseriaceae bacterium]|nr:DUF3018 family protein [Neisseriaceae bacterium]